MKIVIVKNPIELGKKAFEYMADVVKNNPYATLGLATGSTPLPLYREMILDHENKGTSYKHIKTFNLDEYVGLDASSEQSYIRFMKDNLFDSLDINLNNVNIPNGLAQDLQQECKRYSKLLAENSVDIQILGIGGNGHIAFNEPKTPFDSKTHAVSLTEKTISDNARFFDDISQVPTQALTMGISEIVKAKLILILATGENKADAVFNMINGPISENCPASILQRHPNTVVILDEDAALKLN